MKARDEIVPSMRHAEVWSQLEENNRFLRRLAGFCCTWALAALAAGSYGLLVGLYRPLAFSVTPDGQARAAGRLGQASDPNEAEVRFVAKEFLKRMVGLCSATVDEDLASAWNLMTKDLQDEQTATLERYQKEQGEDFVSFIRRQNVRTDLVFNEKSFEISAHGASAFSIRVHALARTMSLSEMDDAKERKLEAFIVLIKKPRTDRTPNGLLVSKFSSRLETATQKIDNRKETR